MLSDRQIELQKIISTLRKQVELLDSHLLTGLITEKQHKESLYYIAKKVDELEKELGVMEHTYNAFDLMFGESMEKFNKMFDYRVHKAIDEIDEERDQIDSD